MAPISGAGRKCPTCGRALEGQAAGFGPFCSERCRLIDLGAWLSGQRAIAGEPAAPDAAPAGAQEAESEP